LAYDVTRIDSKGNLTGKPVNPGETSTAQALIANQGDRTSVGLKVRIELPKLVTFAEKFDGCEYSSNNRVVTCSDDEYPLIPVDEDTTADKERSALRLGFPVTVSKDAKGPVSLTGGSYTATALGVQADDARNRRAAAAAVAPAYAAPALAADVAKIEVDASDNTDGFAVLVAGADNGQGGGTGTDGGTDGGLPVTGPVAATAGGLGIAVAVAGGVLFLAARRRRVVLVTPDDGK
jgi:hypothetical protein